MSILDSGVFKLETIVIGAPFMQLINHLTMLVVKIEGKWEQLEMLKNDLINLNEKLWIDYRLNMLHHAAPKLRQKQKLDLH